MNYISVITQVRLLRCVSWITPRLEDTIYM